MSITSWPDINPTSILAYYEWEPSAEWDKHRWEMRIQQGNNKAHDKDRIHLCRQIWDRRGNDATNEGVYGPRNWRVL